MTLIMSPLFQLRFLLSFNKKPLKAQQFAVRGEMFLYAVLGLKWLCLLQNKNFKILNNSLCFLVQNVYWKNILGKFLTVLVMALYLSTTKIWSLTLTHVLITYSYTLTSLGRL